MSLTSAVDAKEGRHKATVDVPNAFMQAQIDTKPGDPRVVMVLRGLIVDMLCELDEEKYRSFVTMEKGKKVLRLIVHRAMHGLVQSPMLWYKKWRQDIESQGFTVNPCDPCVAKKMVNGKQLTLLWHVDDVKISHMEEKVVTEFINWMKTMYEDENGTLTVTRGEVHPFLGMTLDFTDPGVVKIDMRKCVDTMLKDYEEIEPIGTTKECPWTEKLFSVDETSHKLNPDKADSFHAFVAKALFLCKRARIDIQPVVTFLCARVKEPTEQDWKKLLRLMKFLKKTKDVVLPIQMIGDTLNWHWDASFAVHPDCKSHTGGALTMGAGVILAACWKQKIMTNSSTTAELVGVDDGMGLTLWTRLFMEAQGVTIENNVIHQDNKSAILLEKNGKASSSKRTRHMNIRYFFVTDQIKQGHATIEYCPTDQMIADYFTKPLTGTKFRDMWSKIMNQSFPQCEDTGVNS